MKLNEMLESSASLLDKLLSLKPEIVEMAQEIYDDWDQKDDDGDDGDDDQYGTGGICDVISLGISEILTENDIEIAEGGHDGDDHSFTIAYDEQGAYIVDIPSYVYETGGGYNWTKLGGVKFTPDDIEISTTETPDWI